MDLNDQNVGISEDFLTTETKPDISHHIGKKISLLKASEVYKQFIRDLIVAFRKQPILWDKNHPSNRNKEARAKALEEIYMSLSHYPDSNVDYIFNKLETIKCTFRREYNKVQESKKTAKSPEEIFKPTLWYYNDLLFYVGADPEKDKVELESVRENPNFVWNREDTIDLIELIKEHPVLFEQASWTKELKAKKDAVIRNIAKLLSAKTGKAYDFCDVRQKIERLRTQRQKELWKHKQTGVASSLWCYDLLDFMDVRTEEKAPKKVEKAKSLKFERISDEESSDFNCSDDSTTNEKKRKLKKTRKVKIKKERKDSVSKTETFSEDIFDVIGKHVVLKLKEMTEDQRMYAANLVNEILYHGMMESLRWDTKVTI